MAMNLPDLPSYPLTIDSLPCEGVPLHNSPDGQVRIDGTRISLEIFIESYHLGNDTPELLAERFPSVSLASAQSVLAYWQQHRAEVDEYLRRSEEKAEKVRHAIVTHPEHIAWWNRIKERARAKGLDGYFRDQELHE